MEITINISTLRSETSHMFWHDPTLIFPEYQDRHVLADTWGWRKPLTDTKAKNKK